MLKPLTLFTATHYCACGKAAARWMFGDKLVLEKKVNIVPNAIDLATFSFDNDARARLRAELGLAPHAFILGHVGRFVYQKNHAFLLDIFVHVLAACPDAHLLLVGEGPLMQLMQRRIMVLGISASVSFLGPRQDMAALYSVMDALALPSYYEGVPVVGIESQANGLPCCFANTISDEAMILPNTRALSLSDSPSVWAESLLAGQRTSQSLPEEYDIQKQAAHLTQYYCSLMTRCA